MNRLAALLVASFSLVSAEAFPITYQGVLRVSGSPANGTYSMTFNLTDSSAGGLLLQSVVMPAVSVQNGLFTVQIEFDDVHLSGANRWIAVVVEGTSLSPRQRVTYAPYAIYTDRAREAGTVSVPLSLIGQTVVIEGFANATNGIGVRGVHLAASGTDAGLLGQTNSLSANAAGVYGEVAISNPGGFSAGVRGVNNSISGNGVGVYGSQAGSGWGVYGTVPDGRGVFGNSTNGTGVRGSSSGGFGVQGTASGGTGVEGISSGGTAIHGTSNSSFGLDVTSGSGIGARAQNTGASTLAELGTPDFAVHGTNTNDPGEGTAISGTGGRIGVEGIALPNGFGIDLTRIGVRGFAGGFSTGAQTIIGVSGFGQSPDGGGSRNAYGIYGGAQSGSSANTGYGVYGTSVGPGVNWAAYFQGNVHVMGTLTKAAGAFKIDHPSDPQNKYLSHSFVESPEMLNVYSGIVRLDEQGHATVQLPAYFQDLNESFRYQLTPVGAAMRDLHIAVEVSGNTFEIGGGVAGGKVSWQVSGVRHDAAAKRHPIIVEEDKAPDHRGKFLDPEAYGQTPAQGIHPPPSVTSQR